MCCLLLQGSYATCINRYAYIKTDFTFSYKDSNFTISRVCQLKKLFFFFFKIYSNPEDLRRSLKLQYKLREISLKRERITCCKIKQQITWTGIIILFELVLCVHKTYHVYDIIHHNWIVLFSLPEPHFVRTNIPIVYWEKCGISELFAFFLMFVSVLLRTGRGRLRVTKIFLQEKNELKSYTIKQLHCNQSLAERN